MAVPIVIIHGWSDNYKSFERLADYLRKNLNTIVTTIDLADWVSMDDEITYRDLRYAMETAWRNHAVLKGKKKINIVSHSTGALVVRDWLTHYYTPDTTPIKRHIMLAPANFGSQLAHKGKTWYGRAFKGFKHGFETGKFLLNGLELGSPYTWELAQRDLFSAKRWYGPDKIMAAVIVGNTGFGGVAAVVDEEGGDGTVRVSTANLNAAILTVDFTGDSGAPQLKFKNIPKALQIAFGVADGDSHSSVAFKAKDKSAIYQPSGPNTAKWILKALRTAPASWGDFVEELKQSNEALYRNASEKNEYFHAYQNTVVRLSDDIGNPVEEFLVEFHRGRKSTFDVDFFGTVFQRRIIRGVHNYSGDSSYRSFYLDVTSQQEMKKNWLYLEIEALPEFKKKSSVGYQPLGRIRLDENMLSKLFVPNRTLLVDVKVRRQVSDKAFRLIRHS
ncbi:MAG: alpha/beta hydrolase [Deltaproteobacteria bacterium]|nr:alpha/beta hydrolase [Deltaproteobacteria bacterium]